MNLYLFFDYPSNIPLHPPLREASETSDARIKQWIPRTTWKRLGTRDLTIAGPAMVQKQNW